MCAVCSQSTLQGNIDGYFDMKNVANCNGPIKEVLDKIITNS